MPVAVKIILGLMTLWGVVYAFAALAGDFALVPSPDSGREAVSGLEAFIIHVHALNALAIFLIYTFIVLGLRRLAAARRVAWVFMFMFFYPIALPVFWWVHIWRAPQLAAPDSTG